jgi:phospholipid/cholesterol/gamma-HCH transport system ATP-binding protein
MRNQVCRRTLPGLAVAAGRGTGKEAGAEEWAHVGVAVEVEGLTKSFGSQNIWSDVTLTLPPGEISVLLGPSGTGKSVFLKSLVGLLKPEEGSIVINDVDLVRTSEHKLYEIRKLFGVLFQDGALFGSMNLFDNIAFPLREHTKKSESEVKSIVLEKMEMVGLEGSEGKLPGEISGGMRKRAGLARSLVLDPKIILCDEPDSGLDPVRTAYLSQLLIDINAQIDCTILIVTHNISTARTVPDNLGLLFRRNLVMFGPREQLLTSQEPVVRQFLNGRKEGPIGMSEEKDVAQVEAEMKALEERGGDSHNGIGPKGASGGDAVPPQLTPSEGLPERQGERRRQERVARMLHEFDEDTREAIRKSLPEDLLAMADSGQFEPTSGSGGRHWAPDDHQGQSARSATATLPRQGDEG